MSPLFARDLHKFNDLHTVLAAGRLQNCPFTAVRLLGHETEQ